MEEPNKGISNVRLRLIFYFTKLNQSQLLTIALIPNCLYMYPRIRAQRATDIQNQDYSHITSTHFAYFGQFHKMPDGDPLWLHPVSPNAKHHVI